jgi:hypothetical protein
MTFAKVKTQQPARSKYLVAVLYVFSLELLGDLLGIHQCPKLAMLLSLYAAQTRQPLKTFDFFSRRNAAGCCRGLAPVLQASANQPQQAKSRSQLH